MHKLRIMNFNNIEIRKATEKDYNSVMEIEKLAFGQDKEAELTADLLVDPTATPCLSLLAICNNEAVGHILFSRVHIENNPEPLFHILAPLAVKPNFQKKGIGGLLIKRGHEILHEMGTELVFVLGHIDYYPKSGYINNAAKFGYNTPYPIPEEVSDAWMVYELKPDTLKKYSGRLIFADALMKPEYWRE